jgi:hypothetical protein
MARAVDGRTPPNTIPGRDGEREPAAAAADVASCRRSTTETGVTSRGDRSRSSPTPLTLASCNKWLDHMFKTGRATSAGLAVRVMASVRSSRPLAGRCHRPQKELVFCASASFAACRIEVIHCQTGPTSRCALGRR